MKIFNGLNFCVPNYGGEPVALVSYCIRVPAGCEVPAMLLAGGGEVLALVSYCVLVPAGCEVSAMLLAGGGDPIALAG